MSILANITEAAAAFLLDAADYRDLGVELKTLDDKATARELETEGFGTVHLECETHGRCSRRPDYCRYCARDGLRQVFMINDDGQSWLVDAGKLED